MSSAPKYFGFGFVVSLLLTIFVRSRFGEEVFVCDGSDCAGSSGTKSLLTGLAFIGPLVAAAGFTWSSMLHQRGRLVPTAKWAVPDFEQIFEVLGVLAAGLASYWLILNGPSIEAVEVRQVNQWANDLRNFRAEEGTPTTDLVPSTVTWFVIGAVLSAPFWLSFGAMLGRETIGRRNRKEAAVAALAVPPRQSGGSFTLEPGELKELSRATDETAEHAIDLDEPGYHIDLSAIENGTLEDSSDE